MITEFVAGFLAEFLRSVRVVWGTRHPVIESPAVLPTIARPRERYAIVSCTNQMESA